MANLCSQHYIPPLVPFLFISKNLLISLEKIYSATEPAVCDVLAACDGLPEGVLKQIELLDSKRHGDIHEKGMQLYDLRVDLESNLRALAQSRHSIMDQITSFTGL